MRSKTQVAAISTCSFLLLLTLDRTGKGAGQDAATSIEVNPDIVTGRVSPYFFGQFIEHEHNTIQGGLWAELLRDRKFEQGDVNGDGVSKGWVPEERIQDRYWQIQNGRTANVKYFIDHKEYRHWENGIGNRDKRPEVYSPAWQEWDPNDFGIDEFMELARELGFEPHITANYVSGTPAEAARWVEYVNGSPDTAMGRRRAANGHLQPYRIKYWAMATKRRIFARQTTPAVRNSTFTSRDTANIKLQCRAPIHRFTSWRPPWAT